MELGVSCFSEQVKLGTEIPMFCFLAVFSAVFSGGLEVTAKGNLAGVKVGHGNWMMLTSRALVFLFQAWTFTVTLF